MKKALVIGGTGHLGRALVAQLLARHRAVRLFSRHAGSQRDVQWSLGDLATGAGLDDALQDVDVVIHAATHSPIARRGTIRPLDLFTSPSDVDVEGTRRVLVACERAAIEHFIFVSIVGIDGAALPYAKVKLTGEKLVRASPLPWSVVRASGFYYLLERMFAGARWWPVWPLPDAAINPVDTPDVAAYLTECLDDGRRGVREEIGGPETASFVEFARQYQRVAGLRRPIVPISVSNATAEKFGFTPAHGRRGKKTWSDWLSEHFSASGASRAQAA